MQRSNSVRAIGMQTCFFSARAHGDSVHCSRSGDGNGIDSSACSRYVISFICFSLSPQPRCFLCSCCFLPCSCRRQTAARVKKQKAAKNATRVHAGRVLFSFACRSSHSAALQYHKDDEYGYQYKSNENRRVNISRVRRYASRIEMRNRCDTYEKRRIHGNRTS